MEPADIVRKERLRRGWSVRAAANRGGISNTFWAAFEDYRTSATPAIITAVAKAFRWPQEWAQGDESSATPTDINSRVEKLQAEVAVLQRQVLSLDQTLHSVTDRIAPVEPAAAAGGRKRSRAPQARRSG